MHTDKQQQVLDLTRDIWVITTNPDCFKLHSLLDSLFNEINAEKQSLIESIEHYNDDYLIEDKVAEFLINDIKMLGK